MTRPAIDPLIMKPVASAAVLGVLLFVVSCERKPDRHFPAPELKAAEVAAASASPISPAVEQTVREKGDAIVAQAFGVLSSRLGRVIAEAGRTNAIEFCSVHGISLTTSVRVTNDVVLRRVTHRPRNPQNRTDTHELAIIRRIEAELRAEGTPKPVVSADKPGVLTYYAPIVLKLPLCLNCHGEPGANIHPDVLAQIKKTYPTEEATGFKQGQLRGLWSVEFKRSDFVAGPGAGPGK